MIVKRKIAKSICLHPYPSLVKAGFYISNGPESSQLFHFGIVPEKECFIDEAVTLDGVYSTRIRYWV